MGFFSINLKTAPRLRHSVRSPLRCWLQTYRRLSFPSRYRRAPQNNRHRYHGVFAPNHKLRRAVTTLAIGNVGKRRENVTCEHACDNHPMGSCCDATHATQKPRSHDTSRTAWAKLMARLGEEFPLEPPPLSPARGPPNECAELVQAHDDRNVFQATDRRAARDRHPQPLSGARSSLRRREKNATAGGAGRFEKPAPDARAAPPEAYESLISRKTGAEVPLTGLSLAAEFTYSPRCLRV